MDEKETNVTFTWAHETDLPAILTLLKACALPTEEVDAVLPTLLIASEGKRLVGCAAVEVYGTVALLRSVAVHPTHRSHRLGQQLVQAILAYARSLSLRKVYLLTETASDYFPRFGFCLVERSAVAPAIRASVEWTSACPESAYAMMLRLDGT